MIALGLKSVIRLVTCIAIPSYLADDTVKPAQGSLRNIGHLLGRLKSGGCKKPGNDKGVPQPSSVVNLGQQCFFAALNVPSITVISLLYSSIVSLHRVRLVRLGKYELRQATSSMMMIFDLDYRAMLKSNSKLVMAKSEVS